MALVHRLSPPFLSAGMGTVVEHPLFSLGEIQNNIDGNSRTNSVEIIDVDAHDEPSSLSQAPLRPRPALRPRHSFHPDSIISLVDDSDDEVQILSDPIQASSQETTNRRRLRSPPPYSSMNTPPPPVPSIPRRFAGFTSLPAGRGAAPPVRPNPRPFAFEQNPRPSIASSTDRHSHFLPPSRGTTVPQAAGHMPPAVPPSHHIPSMGLGGALISSNNARAQQEAGQAARAAVRMNHAIRRRPMSWLVTAAANFDELLFHDPVDNPPQIRRWLESQRDNFVRLYNRLHGHEESQAKYYQKYTHPDQPEPGFTFDFAPNASDEDSPLERRFPPTSVNAPIVIDDDDEQPSMGELSTSANATAPSFSSPQTPTAITEPGKLTTVLVCARCMVPLLLNESLGPDDSGRRVWALRCGHMIDEQCLNDIGQPDEEAEPDTQSQQTVVDRKGKGKARARPKASYGEAVVSAVEPIENNIRSRLRSAASAASSSSPSVSQPPPTKRRRTAAVNKIESEFEWKCPVLTCQLPHVSVKMDGKWGPEKEAKQLDSATKARGAIPVFA